MTLFVSLLSPLVPLLLPLPLPLLLLLLLLLPPAAVLLLPPDAGTLRSNQSSAATRARRLTLFTRRMLSGIRSIPEVRGPNTLSDPSTPSRNRRR